METTFKNTSEIVVINCQFDKNNKLLRYKVDAGPMVS